MNSMHRRIAASGYNIVYNPDEDSINCFYRAAAYQLGIEWESVKEQIFNYLEDNRHDVS